MLPNRDALQYVPLFALGPGCADQGEGGPLTVFRGTLRYAGWAADMLALRRRGLLDSSAAVPPGARSWAAVARLLHLEEPRPGEAAADTARFAELARELGLLDGAEVLTLRRGDDGAPYSLRDACCALLARRLAYGEDERDVVLMEHSVLAHWPAEGLIERSSRRSRSPAAARRACPPRWRARSGSRLRSACGCCFRRRGALRSAAACTSRRAHPSTGRSCRSSRPRACTSTPSAAARCRARAQERRKGAAQTSAGADVL